MQVKYSIPNEEPDEEPVTLEEAKAHLRVDLDDDDDLITSLIIVSRETLESQTSRAFVKRSFTMKMDCLPKCFTIPLRQGNVDASTIEIKYFDTSENEQTLASSEYWIDTHGPITRIVTRNTWPGTFFGMPNAVSITYDAGFGTADEIPKALKQAMLLLIGHLYENRQSIITNGVGSGPVELPMSVQYLITAYIIVQDATD